uniref:Uncharacterized protein n=1 Tax=Mycena chlorophos TaxID=658473 RepID=A0ABQ0LY69_MYCCL|nr:predicted protein [Mycena chlorophos]
MHAYTQYRTGGRRAFISALSTSFSHNPNYPPFLDPPSVRDLRVLDGNTRIREAKRHRRACRPTTLYPSRLSDTEPDIDILALGAETSIWIYLSPQTTTACWGPRNYGTRATAK